MLNSFDLWFVAQQAALLTCIVIVPVLGYTLLARGAARVGFWLAVAAVWGLFVLTIVKVSADVWAEASVPYVPFRTGPSFLSLKNLIAFVALTVWLPFLCALAVRRWRRRGSAVATPSYPRWIPVFVLVTACLQALWLAASDYAHEDTIFAEEFTTGAWNQVQVGMSRARVEELLGPPLPQSLQPRFDAHPGATCWARNWSAGYFAAVWFEGDRVSRTQFWFSD